jgi:hypothetical protein
MNKPDEPGPGGPHRSLHDDYQVQIRKIEARNALHAVIPHIVAKLFPALRTGAQDNCSQRPLLQKE